MGRIFTKFDTKLLCGCGLVIYVPSLMSPILGWWGWSGVKRHGFLPRGDKIIVSLMGRFLPVKTCHACSVLTGFFYLEFIMKREYTFTQFAYAVGATDRMTQEASLPFHEEYTANEDKAFRAKMRKDWTVSYVAGNLKVSQAKAIAICEMTRVERLAKDKDLEDSVNRAGKKFSYHVVRAEGSSKQVDLVKQALALYAKMSGAQKRSFKAQL